jgi:putative SOS response-associated peptidase YedK
MALAGLWEGWRSPAGEWLRSFTIVTTSANPMLAPLHERMPVILDPDAWPVWLGEEEGDAERLISLMVPYPEEKLALWPVDKRVGNVKNNDAGLIERVEPDAEA